MSYRFFAAAGLLLLAAVGSAQAAPKSVLAPVENSVRAIVLRAQPGATFATGPDILLAQYRTSNHVYQPHDASGHLLPPQVQLGPRPGGFYLQLDVAKSQGQATVQTTAPSAAQPWTTVTSTYPLAAGKKMIVMTWEATRGAPRALAAHVRAALLHYAAHAK